MINKKQWPRVREMRLQDFKKYDDLLKAGQIEPVKPRSRHMLDGVVLNQCDVCHVVDNTTKCYGFFVWDALICEICYFRLNCTPDSAIVRDQHKRRAHESRLVWLYFRNKT